MNNSGNFLGMAALLTLTGCPSEAPEESSAKEEKRPNLVFVFADQFRYDAIGANGNPQAVTPRLDAFCREGVTLTNATAVCPVSATYRASLLTGKYVSSTGLIINEICMNPNHHYLAQVCTENGYNCGYVGKVHLNDTYERPYQKGPERMGFDDYWATYTFNHHTYLWRDGFEWRCIRSKDYLYARYLRDGKEILFDQRNDPYQMHDLAPDSAYAKVLKKYRRMMEEKMDELGDEFHTCTWYRDHWMYKEFSVRAGARGDFGPLPPLEPIRH